MTHESLCFFREARETDLPAILQLIFDDEFAKQREDLSNLACYQTAFHQIQQDPNQFLMVGEHDKKSMLHGSTHHG